MADLGNPDAIKLLQIIFTGDNGSGMVLVSYNGTFKFLMLTGFSDQVIQYFRIQNME